MEQPVIPVRNIYYMLTYAWGYLQEIKQADLEAIPGNNLLDILGYVLNKGILQLSRRGLELDYNSNTEIIPGIKGRIHRLDSYGFTRLQRKLRIGRDNCVCGNLRIEAARRMCGY